jgi:hypothetical protein
MLYLNPASCNAARSTAENEAVDAESKDNHKQPIISMPNRRVGPSVITVQVFRDGMRYAP